MIATCPSQAELADFASGSLAPAAAADLVAHLEDCSACDERLLQVECRHESLALALATSDDTTAATLDPAYAAARQRLIAAIRAGKFAPASGQVSEVAAPSARRIGNYELREKLGQGGMGEVYRALHVNLQKIVALKLLPEERLHNPDVVQRFRREMAAVGRLDHANIVRALDAGEADGVHYLAMEYVAGVDLSQLQHTHGPLRIADACELVRQAACALEHAHEHGLVHRDVKPSNLMLTPTGCVKLLDMGLARLRVDDGDQAQELTKQYQGMGTYGYMAPEQAISARNVDIRADIYSLGATLLKLLTGDAVRELSPRAQDIAQRIYDYGGSRLACDESDNKAVQSISLVLEKMLRAAAVDRYQTPAEVIEVIAPWAARHQIRSLTARDTSDPPRIDQRTMSTQRYLSLPKTETFSVLPGLSSVATRVLRPARRRFTAVAVSLAFFALAALGTVIYIRTNHGTLELTVEPDVRVKIDGDVVKLKSATDTVRVVVGQHELQVSKDGFETTTKTFQIQRGGRVQMAVRLLPRTPALDGADDSPLPAATGLPKPPPAGELSVLPVVAKDAYAPPAGETGTFHLFNPVYGHYLETDGSGGVTTTSDPRGRLAARWRWKSVGHGVTLQNLSTSEFLALDQTGATVALTQRSDGDAALWQLRTRDERVSLRNAANGKFLGIWKRGRIGFVALAEYWMFTDVALTERGHALSESPVGGRGIVRIVHVHTGRYLVREGSGRLGLAAEPSAAAARWHWQQTDGGLLLREELGGELLEIDGDRGGPILYPTVGSGSYWILDREREGKYTLCNRHQGRWLAVDDAKRPALIAEGNSRDIWWKLQIED